MSDERGGEAPEDGTGYWLVDPIRGTSNYAAGVPLYCVNLALVENDEVTVAVVADASRDELLIAERGTGAWSYRHGAFERLHVSETSGMIIVEDGKATGERRQHAGNFMATTVQAEPWDFRSVGSSLSLPYVAAGRAVAYVVFYITDVHSAPGALLVTEAGSTLTDIAGLPWTLSSDSIVAASTPKLHAELIEMIVAAR